MAAVVELTSDTRAGLQPAAGSLLIVGSPAETHVGRHFARAADLLVEQLRICDPERAYRGIRPLKIFNWRLRGRRPTHLSRFSREVRALCEAERPTWLLATGVTPIEREALHAIGRL